MHKLTLAVLLGTTMVATAATASPAVMVQPKDAVIIDGGPGFGSIIDTLNQRGLAAAYIDEVTDLHSFAPTSHTPTFAGFEWFGNSGTTTASVSYFVSAVRPQYIDHLVLWNEESSGIGSFDLFYGATAGALTTLLIPSATPFDNPLASYSGEIFHFRPSPKVGWYTIVARGCPQPDPGSFPACAIGEVAFGGPAVPEPATWAMMIAGFGLVGTALRRRSAVVATA